MTQRVETSDGNKSGPLVSMGRVCDLLDLTPELVRAWERRYTAIEPQRTPGGARRYGTSEIKRLRLLKTLVDHGTRIGAVANLATEELEARVGALSAISNVDLLPMIEALEKLDAATFERLVFGHFDNLGPHEFVHRIASPLVSMVGDGWEQGKLSVASEHLASNTLRSLLGSSLLGKTGGTKRPTVLFATAQGERHEFGILFAALMAEGVGAKVIYLGTNLPLSDIHSAVESTHPMALAISMVHGTPKRCRDDLVWLRSNIDDQIPIFVGGAAANDIPLPDGVELTTNLKAFGERVTVISDERIT